MSHWVLRAAPAEALGIWWRTNPEGMHPGTQHERNRPRWSRLRRGVGGGGSPDWSSSARGTSGGGCSSDILSQELEPLSIAQQAVLKRLYRISQCLRLIRQRYITKQDVKIFSHLNRSKLLKEERYSSNFYLRRKFDVSFEIGSFLISENWQVA